MSKIKKVKEQKYRLLNAGERMKEGDSVWVVPDAQTSAPGPLAIAKSPYWRDIGSKFAGRVVIPSDPPVRRPIKR